MKINAHLKLAISTYVYIYRVLLLPVLLRWRLVTAPRRECYQAPAPKRTFSDATLAGRDGPWRTVAETRSSLAVAPKLRLELPDTVCTGRGTGGVTTQQLRHRTEWWLQRVCDMGATRCVKAWLGLSHNCVRPLCN